MTETGDLFGANISSFIQHLEESLVLFEDRITRLGTDFTRYWYISAARSLLSSIMNQSDVISQKRQAIELVARQYYRIRGSQEDLITVKNKVCLSCTLGPFYGVRILTLG